MTSAVPRGTSGGSPTRGEGLSRSEQPPQRPVVERAVDALRDVPGLVRLQKEDALLGKDREARGGEGETRGGELRGETEVVRYLTDDQNLVWHEVEQSGVLSRPTSVLAVPGVWVADVLALVHCQHGYRGVGRTLPLLRDRFHWPGGCRDAMEYVLPCGCRRRKRTRSQRIAMLTGKFLEPWEGLEVDLLRIPKTSKTARVCPSICLVPQIYGTRASGGTREDA